MLYFEVIFTHIKNYFILAMGSDCRIIRLWDAKKEMRIMDLFTEDSSGAVTSLHYAPTTSASSLADLLIAGFTGGSVKIFDAREWGRAPILKLDDLQGSPILDAKIQDCGGQNILWCSRPNRFTIFAFYRHQWC